MIKDFVRDLKAGRVSRREAARTLAAFGLGLALMPVPRRPALAAENNIILLTWEGYDAPELHPDYVAKYGGSPESTWFASEEEALQKLRAGFRATVAHPCTYAVARWQQAGVIQPIDTGRLKNYPDLFEGLTQIPGTVIEGQHYFVPVDWGNSSIVYRTDLTDFQEESWTMLYDERYAGRIAMSTDAEANVEVAGLALGYSNVFDMSDEQLVEVRKLMLHQKKLLRFYWDSQTSMEQAVAAGEVVAAYGWNASAFNLQNQGIPARFAQPKEGILTWCCGLTLLSNPVGDLDAAYDLIDAMLEPEVGKYFIEDFYYGHSNRKAFELAAPESIAALGMQDPGELFTSGIFFESMKQEVVAKYVELFNEIQI